MQNSLRGLRRPDARSVFSFDTDGGGVSDGIEVLLYGTDPLDPSDDISDPTDSDGDGLSDGDEVYIHQTDPTLADTDGGGVDDGDELDRGTDLLDHALIKDRHPVGSSISLFLIMGHKDRG